MKNKVLYQAFILGFGQVGGKILSLVFLFRLAQDMKDSLYLYTYAYIPFSLFLDISSFGLIPGIAKIISIRKGTFKEEENRYILKVGSLFCIWVGATFYLLLNIFNHKILAVSLYQGYTQQEYDIILNHLKIASLSLFIVPLLSFYKGYLQGHLKIAPSALAIVLENLCRVILYCVIPKEEGYDWIQSVFYINFLSYGISILFLFCFVIKDYFRFKSRTNALSEILRVCLPFGTVTMFFSLYQLIDSITLSSLGLESHIYTSYMFETVRLIFIPIVLSQSVGGALNPKINLLNSKNKTIEARRLAVIFTNLMIYVLIPVVFLYQIYAKELYSFFYKNDSLFYILKDISIFIFFIGFYKVLIGLSQGFKDFKYVVITTFISLLAKIILNHLFVPEYNYMGAIAATVVAIGICMAVSYYVLSKGGIPIFLTNVKTSIIAIIITVLSIYFASIIRVSFFILYPSYLQTILFILFVVILYLFFYLHTLLVSKVIKNHKVK